MRKLLIIIVVILAIALVLSFIKDMVIKTSIEKGVELVTGLPLKMRSLNVGIIRTGPPCTEFILVRAGVPLR